MKKIMSKNIQRRENLELLFGLNKESSHEDILSSGNFSTQIKTFTKQKKPEEFLGRCERCNSSNIFNIEKMMNFRKGDYDFKSKISIVILQLNKMIILLIFKKKNSMGGKVFENKTRSMSVDEYEQKIALIRQRFVEGIDFLLPYRLGTKMSYNDIDLFVWNPEKFLELLNDITQEVEKIDLCDGEFSSYHILTVDHIQIDLLVALNQEGMELMRCYHSYTCSGVFFKKFITCDNTEENCKMTSDKYPYKLGYNGIQITNKNILNELTGRGIKTYKTQKRLLIIDVQFLFELMGLDYLRFTQGFFNEFDLLDYLKTSSQWHKVYFINNSSYRRDYVRLPTFKRLCDANLLRILPSIGKIKSLSYQKKIDERI